MNSSFMENEPEDVDEKDSGDLDAKTQAAINKELISSHSSAKHDATRIKLFENAVGKAIWALGAFGLLLTGVVVSYIVLLFSRPEVIPGNFWHIPTLVGFITISILVSLLRFTSNFGNFTQTERKSDKEKSGLDAATLDCIDKIVNIIDKRKGS